MSSTTAAISQFYIMMTSYSKHYEFLKSWIGHVKRRQNHWQTLIEFYKVDIKDKNKTVLLRDTAHQTFQGESAAAGLTARIT